MGGPDDPHEDVFALPPPSDRRRGWAAKTSRAAVATVTGRLGFDDIEGGCSFLDTNDGTRYEVVYPEGWILDRMQAELRGPGGQLAHAGDAVTARGTIARDRSSICQIGPVFVATAVEIPST